MQRMPCETNGMETRSAINSTINNDTNTFYSSAWSTNFKTWGGGRSWARGERSRGWNNPQVKLKTISVYPGQEKRVIGILASLGRLHWEVFSYHSPRRASLPLIREEFKPHAKHSCLGGLLSAEIIFISSCRAKLRGLYQGIRYWSRISWVFREIRK